MGDGHSAHPQRRGYGCCNLLPLSPQSLCGAVAFGYQASSPIQPQQQEVKFAETPPLALSVLCPEGDDRVTLTSMTKPGSQ